MKLHPLIGGPRSIHSTLVALAVGALMLPATSTVSLADYECVSHLTGLACPNVFNCVWADLDNNGSYETFVTFLTIDGEAYAPGYFFTPVNGDCGGVAPWPKAKIAVWFVDATAPGFVANNPSTWQYKSVPAVTLSVNSDEHVGHGDYTTAYRQVAAYTQRNRGGTLLDQYTYRATDPDFPDNSIHEYNFSSESGIMEVYVNSDFVENLLGEFWIHSHTLPTVTVAATGPVAGEHGQGNGTFTFSRTGSTAGTLTVGYNIGGTAEPGQDYTPLAGAVVFSAGSATATVTVTPLDDGLVEPDETVVVTLTQFNGGGYAVGSPSTATVTITDAASGPVNDTCNGAIALSENLYYTENTASATDDGTSTCLNRTRSKGVWFTYTPALTGKATVDTCPSDFTTDIEIFTGACGTLTSIGCNDFSSSCLGTHYTSSFSFSCTAGTPYLIWAGGDNGASGNLQIRAYAAIAPANDDCAGAIALTENVYHAQNTANATDDDWSPCLSRTRSKGVWFAYTPAQTGKAKVDTCPSDFDTMLEVFTGGCGTLTSIGCNDDGCGYQSSLSFTCTAGTTYRIWAGGYNGVSGNLQIRAGLDLANTDTDGDGYSDATEIREGSNPNDPASIPNNVANRMDATAIIGTLSAGGVATPYYHAGTPANINDGNLATRVDNWQFTETDPFSYVGIVWTNIENTPILGLRLDLAAFVNGGWFGPNNQCPSVGGALCPPYLTEPDIQTSYDGGVTWTTLAHTSDYLTALNGHHIAGSDNKPTCATALFRLNSPVSGINGIRLAASSGGSGNFLGVFELEVLTKMPVRLLNPTPTHLVVKPEIYPALQFEFDCQTHATYDIQLNATFDPAGWQTVATTQSTEYTHITVTTPVSRYHPTFSRVLTR